MITRNNISLNYVFTAQDVADTYSYICFTPQNKLIPTNENVTSNLLLKRSNTYEKWIIYSVNMNVFGAGTPPLPVNGVYMIMGIYTGAGLQNIYHKREHAIYSAICGPTVHAGEKFAQPIEANYGIWIYVITSALTAGTDELVVSMQYERVKGV